MSMDTWVLVTDARHVGAMLAAARGLGTPVTAAVVGSRALAELVAAAGPDTVVWVEQDAQIPVEAYAARLAAAVVLAAPRVLISSTAPAARVLLGAAAARRGSVVLPAVVDLAADGDHLVVQRSAVGGAVIETLETSSPVAIVFTGEDVEAPVGSPAAIETIPADLPASDLCLIRTEPAGGDSSGVRAAARVVSVGRGVKSKADLPLIEELAAALGAEIGCSMPVADDLGWISKDRYVGRSGQHIAPRLYVALGISGAPQHMEGIRDAKVVVAVNSDKDAPIFRTADFGIVGDLYEVVPALVAALGTT
ncbi:electron transfer flavoprotein subunit alpha/FixB family protein [Pengzhenrongella frigida]|uniref:Electron transfer flavoprotein subunit alpha/FixB family protein n=1 Tax=Pengzhenrongella frigida TaxID=1259133 RepID=A0A4Q5N457_9MICO|nr:electron transfer flavoprotein subunit alpha/FixB family protein [Cellulomonas sp. HLT2-17]RYV53042.1 electron transfer flavoprotein subunit alpha/FixB family protein [Cellulomonas sp. HLT2-17]